MYKVFAAFKQKYLLILLNMLLWCFRYSMSASIKMTERIFRDFGLKTWQKLNSSLAWQLWKLNVLKCNVACSITEDSFCSFCVKGPVWSNSNSLWLVCNCLPSKTNFMVISLLDLTGMAHIVQIVQINLAGSKCTCIRTCSQYLLLFLIVVDTVNTLLACILFKMWPCGQLRDSNCHWKNADGKETNA